MKRQRECKAAASNPLCHSGDIMLLYIGIYTNATQNHGIMLIYSVSTIF